MFAGDDLPPGASEGVGRLLGGMSTGWKPFAALGMILLAWMLRGVLPEMYKTRIEWKKFLKEHLEKMEKLLQKRKKP